MDYLVTYDISTINRAGERRLAAVAKICEGYGQRVQKSVFECRLDDLRLAQLTSALETVIEPKADSVRLYRLGPATRDTVLVIGRPRERELGEPWIL